MSQCSLQSHDAAQERRTGKQESYFYITFLLHVPEDCWGSVAQTGGFQFSGLSLPSAPFFKPGTEYTGAVRWDSFRWVEGRFAKADVALCWPPSMEQPGWHQTLPCLEDMPVPFSGLHQPLPPLWELKQKNGESLSERAKCFVASREIANIYLCTPTRKVLERGVS